MKYKATIGSKTYTVSTKRNLSTKQIYEALERKIGPQRKLIILEAMGMENEYAAVLDAVSEETHNFIDGPNFDFDDYETVGVDDSFVCTIIENVAKQRMSAASMDDPLAWFKRRIMGVLKYDPSSWDDAALKIKNRVEEMFPGLYDQIFSTVQSIVDAEFDEWEGENYDWIPDHETGHFDRGLRKDHDEYPEWE